MSRPHGWYRWVAGLCGAGLLLQTGACQLNSTQFQQLVVPTVASVVSDTLFFFLDSAFVRLTT